MSDTCAVDVPDAAAGTVSSSIAEMMSIVVYVFVIGPDLFVKVVFNSDV